MGRTHLAEDEHLYFFFLLADDALHELPRLELRGYVGAELGMQRSFWGGVNRPLMEQIAAMPPGTRVFFDHMNWDAFRMYQREGTLPRSIQFANDPAHADAATVFMDRENPIEETGVWSSIGTRPSTGVYVDNVGFVELYRRSSSP